MSKGKEVWWIYGLGFVCLTAQAMDPRPLDFTLGNALCLAGLVVCIVAALKE